MIVIDYISACKLLCVKINNQGKIFQFSGFGPYCLSTVSDNSLCGSHSMNDFKSYVALCEGLKTDEITGIILLKVIKIVGCK